MTTRIEHQVHSTVDAVRTDGKLVIELDTQGLTVGLEGEDRCFVVDFSNGKLSVYVTNERGEAAFPALAAIEPVKIGKHWSVGRDPSEYGWVFDCSHRGFTAEELEEETRESLTGIVPEHVLEDFEKSHDPALAWGMDFSSWLQENRHLFRLGEGFGA